MLGAASPIGKVALKSLSDETLVRTALFFGAVSLTLLLAVDSLWTLLLRLVVAAVGAAVLLLQALRPRPDAPATEFGWITGPLLLTIGFAVWAFVTHRDTAASSVTLVAAMLLASSTNQWIQLRRDRPLVARKRAIEMELSRATTRLRGGQLVPVASERLRPGEEIVIHAGDTVPADVTVTSGRAEVNPWLGATIVRQVEPGESLYAGARLRSGQLRATVRWTGQDRHILRLLEDPARRVDWFAPLVLLGRKLSQRGALAVVVTTLLLGLLLGTEASQIALWALALSSCLLLPSVHTLPANRATLAILDLLDRGVVIGNARVLEAMGKISTTVFCARGTLLLGEPELSHIEAFSSLRSDEILSLVVGAEQYGRHPVAVAVSRAARARGIHPDAVRTPQALPGLGVTAVTSDGKHLVVGSRALMLKERISVARAEDKIAEIEASGRTVLLVAVAQRLVGLVALQDGLRPGARAAVQHLLDVGIEPVLLSGDARQTCEALGKAIDIEHLRPEILPGERGVEIERLKGGGASVAVVGRSPADDVALSAASVSIALPSPGSRSTDYDVELASDEVQTAALALGRAHHYRLQTLRGTVAILGANAISGVLILGLSLPAYIAPILSILAMLLSERLMFAESPPSRVRSDRASGPRKD